MVNIDTAAHQMRSAQFSQDKKEAISSWLSFLERSEPVKWPLQVFLELSNACDKRCAMCHVFSGVSPRRLWSIGVEERGFLEEGTTLHNLDDVLRHALAVSCSGYGEPTIHPRFKEMIEKIGSYEVLVDFFTHGMHLTEDLCRSIVRSRVHHVTVSFSGLCADDYESVYLGCKYDQVLNNLKTLSRIKTEEGSLYPRLHINSLALQHHVDTLDHFVDLMADCGASTIHLKKLEPSVNAPAVIRHAAVFRPWMEGKVLERAVRRAHERGVNLSMDQFLLTRVEDEAQYEKMKDAQIMGLAPGESHRSFEDVPIHRLKQIASDLAPVAALDQAACNEPDLLELPPDQAEALLDFQAAGDGFLCLEPFKTMYVRKNGRVKPCCFMYNQVPAMGDAANRSGEALFHETGFALLRKHLLAGSYPAGCRDCVRLQCGPRHHWTRSLIEQFESWHSRVFVSGVTDIVDRERLSLLDDKSLPPLQRKDAAAS